MTTPFGTDRLITSWLEEQAPMREPDGLLEAAIGRVEHTRRLPGWVFLERWIPMQTRARFGAIPRAAIILVTLAVLAIFLGAIALAGSSPPPLPAPFGPAGNGLITYSVNGDIVVADADGSNARTIVGGDAQDVDPMFSHGGTKVLFLRKPEVTDTAVVASTDGTSVTELVNGFQGADFLPGDGRVAVVHRVDGMNVLSIYDLDGSGTIRTVPTGDVEPTGWVAARPPDGREIVFTGWPHAGDPDRGLFAIGADGTGLRTIGDLAPTDSPDDADSTKATYSLQQPVLSPDGKDITYWNWETNPMRAIDSGTYLHMRDLDTGAELPVVIRTSVNQSGYLPHYSPDGSKLIFEGTDAKTYFSQQIWFGPIDGSTAAVPIGPVYSAEVREAFDFSPDGTKVLLAQEASAQSLIIDLATGATTPVPDINGPWGWQRLAP